MKSSIPGLAVCLFLIAASQMRLSAQSRISFSDDYASYNDYSTDDTNIYTSVVVDGQGEMTINGGDGCGSINYGSIVHWPQAVNIISIPGNTTYVGGTLSGSQVCPDCYLSVTNNQSVAATPGVGYNFESVGMVVCSLAGEIFVASFPTVGLRIAVTTYKYQSAANGICTYNQFCGATTASCGADNLTKAAPCTAPYYIADFLVVRVGISSTCVSIGAAAASTTPATCQ